MLVLTTGGTDDGSNNDEAKIEEGAGAIRAPGHRTAARMGSALTICLLLLCILAFGFTRASAQQGNCPQYNQNPAFANTEDTIPPGWPVTQTFQLSCDYPAVVPTPEAYPWKAFDFKTQPREYLQSVLSYTLEGNVDVGWVVQDNPVRTWYHAPGMLKEDGREFIHGLTKERTSRPGELHPNQTEWWQNWAVGFYNPPGGYVLGQVWPITPTSAPDPSKALFPDGTVGGKLLFTTAPDSQVPYLKGTLEWQANINRPTSQPRSVQTVRLLQFDLAVRDTRADSMTGWVFGTYVYSLTDPAKSVWENLVPVGLMWGNDPTMLPGGTPQESWLNPDLRLPHYGYAGRLNGPVDNPLSSCLSCHSTAAVPRNTDVIFPTAASESDRLLWFQNVKAGTPWRPGTASLDYSLQLSEGIDRFPDPAAAPPPAPAAAAAEANAEGRGETFVLREGSPEEQREAEVAEVRAATAQRNLRVGGLAAVAVLLVGAGWLARRRMSAGR